MNTEIHESVHSHHVAVLQKTFGRGPPGFKAAFNDAQDWVRDEINARKAEIAHEYSEGLALRQLRRLRQCRGGCDVVPLLPQEPRQRAQGRLVILHDEHARQLANGRRIRGGGGRDAFVVRTPGPR